MPKIIENLEERLVEEARHQIAESGYGAMTIRSVATACGVGVGTVYNYFPSKDALLAAFMLADWNLCMDAIRAASSEAETPEPVVRCIMEQLRAYAKLHEGIFQDAAAAAGFAGSSSCYHTLLRAQLAAPLQKFCSDGFTGEFIAEALLSWTMAGKDFDELYRMVSKLF